MKKIPSLFVRDYENVITDYEPISVSTMPDGSHSMMAQITGSKKGRFLATDHLTPGCEWVIAGEGIATRKWDGTAVLIEGATMYKRFDAKQGKVPPPNFKPCQDPDLITGHWPGWVPVNPNDPADKWICEAYINSAKQSILDNSTYEAVGPKINGNKHDLKRHMLCRHGAYIYESLSAELRPERTFEGLKQYLEMEPYSEGVVFHHPDGRMCKIKRSDFGLKW